MNHRAKGIIAIIILVGSIAQSACGPSRSTIETQVAESFYATQTAMATSTFTPSATSTLTPTASNTPTSTHTATNTSTPTLPPETQTAIAKETQSARATLDAEVTKTAAAQQATATREQYLANITATANSVAATRTEQAAARTSTAVAVAATKAFLAEYKVIDYRELVSYADNHIGEKVQVRVRVFNIVDNRTLQAYIAGTYEAIYVESSQPFSGIYENTSLTIYGVIKGYKSFLNAMGATISQPYVGDAFFTAPPTPAPTATPTPLPGGAVLIACFPLGGMVNVGNVQSFWIEDHFGNRTAGNGNTGQYMSAFERAIYYARDGSGPYVFCLGKYW